MYVLLKTSLTHYQSVQPSLPTSFSLDDIEVTDVISFDQDHQLELELTEETIRDVQIVVTDGR